MRIACLLLFGLNAAHAESQLQLISGSSVPAVAPANAVSSEVQATSADDRFVVFVSSATNLVPGDSNGLGDIFVRDRTGGSTERVSVSTSGEQGNAAASGTLGISGDGRFVVFASSASNLVADDTNNVSDIFLRDRQQNTTTMLSRSVGAIGNGASTNPTITPDGRFVAFATAATNLLPGDTNARTDVLRLDRNDGSFLAASQTGTTLSNNSSEFPSISADGRFVSFVATATNLVTGDTNAAQDAFRHDFNDRSVIRISVADGGGQLATSSFTYNPNGLSADGQRAIFSSVSSAVPADSNGVQDIYWRDLSNTTVLWASSGGTSLAASASISRQGDRVCYQQTRSFGSETFTRAFVRNLPSDELLDLLADLPGDPSSGVCGAFSPDGLAVHIMTSLATPANPSDWQAPKRVVLADRSISDVAVGADAPQAAGNGSARSLSLGLADDGRTVAFASKASNLVAGDSNAVGDIFVRDTDTGATERISLTALGAQASCRSTGPRMSRNGRFVVFQSCAALVAGDTNGVDDIYLYDRQGATLAWISEGLGAASDGRSWDASVANEGSVSFTSCATNLVPDDSNNRCDVFVRSPGAGVQRIQGAAQPDSNSQDARVSANGEFIAFSSAATNLVAGDSNNQFDVFVLTRATGAVERVSIGASGVQGTAASFSPEVSADGQRVSFVSSSANLATPALAAGTSGIFVRDRSAGTTTLLTKSASGTVAYNGTINTRGGHRLSDDGRFLAFSSSGANIFSAPANTARSRAIWRDNTTGEVRNLNLSAAGIDGDNNSLAIAMTSTGGVVIFDSFAGNLTEDDANFRVPDVFKVGTGDAMFADGFE